MNENNSIDSKKNDLIKLVNSFAKIHGPLSSLLAQMKTFQYHDPLKELRESIKTLQVQFHDPLKELRENIKTLQMQFHDPFKELREQIKALQIHDTLKEFRANIKTLQMQFQDPLKELRDQIKSLQFHDHLTVYKNIFRDSNPANTFEEAYQQIISRFLIEQGVTDDNMDQAAINIIDGIDKEATRIPVTRLSLEFYINLLIALIFFIYSSHLSKESEERLTVKITEMQQVITKQLDALARSKSTAQPDYIYYVTVRIAHLRLKPIAGRLNIVNTLYPNQTVRLLDKKGKWIKIEYFNHFNNSHEHGWVLKKYLKRIK